MSGLLQRLAARAIDSSKSSLRSVARQPYAAVPAPVSGEAADRLITAPGATSTPQHQAVSTTAEWNTAPEPARKHDKPAIEPGEKASEAAVPAASLEVPVTASPMETAVHRDSARPPATTSHPHLYRPKASQGKTAPHEAAVLSGDSAAQLTASATANDSIATDDQFPTLSPGDTPPPLLPLRIAARPSPSDSAAVAPHRRPENRAQLAQREELTEVHVRIGRIEVTAVHEAMPPPRRASSQGKPMTLDAYLARRQEKK